jgi:hypothetical protein
MVNMRYRSLGVLVALIVFVSATTVSYVFLDLFYGARPVYRERALVPETKPLDILPISVSIGAAMGIITIAVWVGSKRLWGDATSTLLERGLHDMTVRDVEIVGHIMEMKEFTIPALMRRSRVSRSMVWRIVQKMIKQGLVQQTEQVGLTARGLGGRGKPSRVYKYVGTR